MQKGTPGASLKATERPIATGTVASTTLCNRRDEVGFCSVKIINVRMWNNVSIGVLNIMGDAQKTSFIARSPQPQLRMVLQLGFCRSRWPEPLPEKSKMGASATQKKGDLHSRRIITDAAVWQEKLEQLAELWRDASMPDQGADEPKPTSA